MMKTSLASKIGFCAGILLTAGAFAQPYAITWDTIDGGGGTSTGGVYAITDTIGQPDAGVSFGGPYMEVGGFWGVLAPPADEDIDAKPDFSEFGDNASLTIANTKNTNIHLHDSDGDGLVDGEEDPDGKFITRATTAMTHPRKWDTDGDTWPDGMELLYPATFPNGPLVSDGPKTDADSDGVPATLEATLGSSDSDTDSDNDFYFDAYEVVQKSNPALSSSKPALGNVNGAGAVDLADVAALADYNLAISTPAGLRNSDMNRNGIIDLVDVSRIADFNLGLTIVP